MDTILKDLSSFCKVPNDSQTQLKMLTRLKDLLDSLRKAEKKKITEIQSKIEDTLADIVIQSRAPNDIIVRYIYYIYKHIFDFGLSSHIADFINKYSSLLHSKTSHNVKGTALWLCGKVCTKAEYKTPNMTELIKAIMKYVKSTSDLGMKHICFGVVSRLLMLKLPFFHTLIPDILKMILKQEKYLTNSKKNIIKALNATIFYLNPQTVEKNYPSLIDIIVRCFDDEDEKVRNIAMQTYISLHTDKVFDNNIQKNKILRKKDYDMLKNFLEVLLYVGTIFNYSKNEISARTKICYIDIMCELFIQNKDYINSSESLITKIYDLLLTEFPISINTNEGMNLVYVNGKLKNSSYNSKTPFNLDISKAFEKLYRCYIKVIYNISFRKTLLLHIFKRFVDSQYDMDKIENSALSLNASKANPSSSSQTQKRDKKYTEYQVNAMLISLVEFSENNSDIFELIYKSFTELSNNISVYVTSSIRSFRILISKVLANLAYYLPSWRISILTLVLNMSSVAHAEVASLRNTTIYFIEESNAEYKYSLIIKKNIDLLKDICNCLALILTMFTHKSHGLPLDTSLNALSRAKNIILGNLIDENDNPKYMSLKQISSNYTNVDLNSYKESGWIILQGLCSMEASFLRNNIKTFLFLWRYVFSDTACDVDEFALNKNEYKDALTNEFFVKKAALASLRKFVLSVGQSELNNELFSQSMKTIVPNLLNFFIPYNKIGIVNFYKEHFSEAYKEAKMFLYDTLYIIPIDVYKTRFNDLLYPLTDEIVSNEYKDSDYEHIIACLNQTDNFMCNETVELDKDKEVEFVVDDFVVERYGFKLTNFMSKNFKFVFSAIKLCVEILLNNSINVKNRVAVFKHFLSNMTEMSMESINKKNIGNYNKILNISIAIFLVIKSACVRDIPIINDEGIFTNSKMIFDFCSKMSNSTDINEKNNLLRLIAAEGHGYLIKASNNSKSNLEYYLSASEVKFKNEGSLSLNEYINTLYMIANIFRYVQFKDIEQYLDNYMNFIISNFNGVEELVANPFMPQAMYVIMDTLIKNDQIDYVRKLIEIYKINFLFMNMKNTFFFKELFETNSLAEIRLMIVLAKLNENIKEHEFELLKMILAKYIRDEKYRSQKIQKNFLFFIKLLLKCHQKIKALVLNENFISFLFEQKENFYEQKLSFEIIISLLMSEFKFDPKKINIKSHIEALINYTNNLYNKNKNFYFNHLIFSHNFSHINSQNLIFDANINDENQNAIASLIDFDNFSHHNFDVLYKTFHLIKLSKFIIRIFIERNYLNVLLLLNLLKELVQSQLILYSSEIQKARESKADSLKGDSDDILANKTKTLLSIRELNFHMHLNMKKFLIKTLQTSLINAINPVFTNHKTSLVDILTFFMSAAMVLVQSEESWEIRILGIKLMTMLVSKFGTTIDERAEDDSLLIQQYEAQISSCIKIIFNNTISIKSVYKGLKLLYMYIAVPISTDPTYIKKTSVLSQMVDLNNLKKNEFSITSGGGDSTSFSEKADHVLICKKVIFFCKLYLSLKSSNDIVLKTYDVRKNQVKSVGIFAKNIKKEFKKSLSDFFEENYEQFYTCVIQMISDFTFALCGGEHKTFYYISNGNRIAYSVRKMEKYGQILLKVLSIMVNDKEVTKIDITKRKSSFDIIFKLFLYYMKINYESICQRGKNKEIAASAEKKIKLALSEVMLIDIFDSFVRIINNDNDIFTLSKENISNLTNIGITLINFAITETNMQTLVLIDCLLKRYINKVENNFENNEKKQFISKVSKILYYFYNKTTLIKNNENMLFIDVNSNLLEFAVKQYKEEDVELEEYIYHNLKFLLNSFVSFTANNAKVAAGKLFNCLLGISNERVMMIFLKEIELTLGEILKQNMFDKFFILFYMIMQYLSKSTDEALLDQVSTFFQETIIVNNLKDKAYTTFIIKTILIGIAQNFDAKTRKVIEEFIINIIQSGYLVPYFNEEIEKILLTYILSEEDVDKRKEIIMIILVYLIENKAKFDIMKLSIFILKMFTKDNEWIKEQEIVEILGEDIKKQIDALIEMQIKYQKEQEEKRKQMEAAQREKEELEKKKREEMKKQLEQKKASSSSSGGPKIKALKFGSSKK